MYCCLRIISLLIAIAALVCDLCLAAGTEVTFKMADILEAGDPYPRYGLDEPMKGEISLATTTANYLHIPLISRSKMHFGWEDAGRRGKKPPVKFEYKVGNLTFRQALDMLVSKDSEYSWAESGGIINIVPQDSVLNIRVPNFTVNDLAIYGAARQLFGQVAQIEKIFQPTLRDIVDRQQKTFALYEMGAPRIKIGLKNSTLRECLNELVLRDGSHDWVLFYPSYLKDPFDFLIEFRPRRSGLVAAHKKAKEKRHKEFEEKALREGFRKGRDGTWSKPGPGGKWVTPEAQIEKPDGNQPKRKENK